MYTRDTIIAAGPRFALRSLGNGAAYTLRDKAGGESVFIYGDDADVLRGEFDLVETTNPDWEPDQVLGWLWDQCGYGDVAYPD